MSFSIKQHDRLPYYSVTLEAPAGTAVDLAGASVKFIMALEGSTTAKVNTAATIDDSDAGEVSYHWAAIDVDTPGLYRAEFEVTFASGIKRTFPGDGYLYVNVVADIA